MLICTVSTVISLYLPNLLDGRFVMLPIFTGIFGIAFYIVIWLDKKRDQSDQETQPTQQNLDPTQPTSTDTISPTTPPQSTQQDTSNPNLPSQSNQ